MALTDLQLKPFADFIKKELGIIYSEQNYFQLEQRLEKIAQIMGMPNVSELLIAAQGGIHGAMKQLLLDIATNNETQFFRDPKVYKAVYDLIFSQLRSNYPNSVSFRIWSAASSFGQEPYSIAMLVDEFLQANVTHPSFDIFATDISDTALKRTAAAEYSQLEVQRGLSAQRLIKYFDKKEEGKWALKTQVKNKVRSERFNLLDPIPLSRDYHLIFCRYVLIYQEQDKKIEIINRMARSLIPGGYLILGASESAMGLCDLLDQVNYEGCVFYRRK